MINIELLLTFIAVSIVIVIVPGPNVTLIIATSAMRGVRAGLRTVAGTTLAQVIQVTMVALGLAWLVETYGAVFDVLRLVGALYLIHLGINMWRTAGNETIEIENKQQDIKKGFWIGLANPKSLSFMAAFFPQFIDATLPANPQFVILSVTYLLIALLFDSGYAVLAGMSGRRFATGRARFYLGRTSGAGLCAGGLWLASLRRT